MASASLDLPAELSSDMAWRAVLHVLETAFPDDPRVWKYVSAGEEWGIDFAAMLADVVQILRRANLHRIRAEEVEVASYTRPPERTMTRLETVERDATRLSMTFQYLAEEEARCRLVPGLA